MLWSEMMTVLPGWGQGVLPVLVWQGLALAISCVPRPTLWQRLAPQAGYGQQLPPDGRGQNEPSYTGRLFVALASSVVVPQ